MDNNNQDKRLNDTIDLLKNQLDDIQLGWEWKYLQRSLKFSKAIEEHQLRMIQREFSIMKMIANAVMKELKRFYNNSEVEELLGTLTHQITDRMNKLKMMEKKVRESFDQMQEEIKSKPNAIHIVVPELGDLPEMPDLFSFYDKILNNFPHYILRDFTFLRTMEAKGFQQAINYIQMFSQIIQTPISNNPAIETGASGGDLNSSDESINASPKSGSTFESPYLKEFSKSMATINGFGFNDLNANHINSASFLAPNVNDSNDGTSNGSSPDSNTTLTRGQLNGQYNGKKPPDNWAKPFRSPPGLKQPEQHSFHNPVEYNMNVRVPKSEPSIDSNKKFEISIEAPKETLESQLEKEHLFGLATVQKPVQNPHGVIGQRPTPSPNDLNVQTSAQAPSKPAQIPPKTVSVPSKVAQQSQAQASVKQPKIQAITKPVEPPAKSPLELTDQSGQRSKPLATQQRTYQQVVASNLNGEAHPSVPRPPGDLKNQRGASPVMSVASNINRSKMILLLKLKEIYTFKYSE